MQRQGSQFIIGVDYGNLPKRESPKVFTQSQPSGTPVTLTSTAENGSTFTGWSGGGCKETGPCTITLNANTSVTAFFLLGDVLVGDLNNDKVVNLLDAILGLQTFVRLTPQNGGIRADYATSATDVNGDNRIGLAEVIYILQKVVGIR
jgi:hypothetical protein